MVEVRVNGDELLLPLLLLLLFKVLKLGFPIDDNVNGDFLSCGSFEFCNENGDLTLEPVFNEKGEVFLSFINEK